MSESDEDTIIGRTLREYRDAKRQLAALHAQAESIGNHLTQLGDALQARHLFSDSYTTGGTLIDLPTRNELVELSKQIVAANEKKERFARLLKEAGFPPAD